jgi:hypothetical protein
MQGSSLLGRRRHTRVYERGTEGEQPLRPHMERDIIWSARIKRNSRLGLRRRHGKSVTLRRHHGMRARGRVHAWQPGKVHSAGDNGLVLEASNQVPAFAFGFAVSTLLLSNLQQCLPITDLSSGCCGAARGVPTPHENWCDVRSSMPLSVLDFPTASWQQPCMREQPGF